jgi:hypothetical protein
MTLDKPLTQAEWDRRFAELYNRGIQVGDIIEAEAGPTGCFRHYGGHLAVRVMIDCIVDLKISPRHKIYNGGKNSIVCFLTGAQPHSIIRKIRITKVQPKSLWAEIVD